MSKKRKPILAEMPVVPVESPPGRNWVSFQVSATGKFFVTVTVDAEDLIKLLPYRWYADQYKHTYYVRVATSNKIYLHRTILGLEKGNPLLADHFNGNGLDNTKRIDGIGNLQAVTKAMNNANRASKRDIPRGVCWSESNNGWIVRVADKYFGTFDDLVEAAQVARKARSVLGLNVNESRHK